MKICLTKQPPMMTVGEDHLSACWLHVQKMRDQGRTDQQMQGQGRTDQAAGGQRAKEGKA